jgi:hypothetical protein
MGTQGLKNLDQLEEVLSRDPDNLEQVIDGLLFKWSLLVLDSILVRDIQRGKCLPLIKYTLILV